MNDLGDIVLISSSSGDMYICAYVYTSFIWVTILTWIIKIFIINSCLFATYVLYVTFFNYVSLNFDCMIVSLDNHEKFSGSYNLFSVMFYIIFVLFNDLWVRDCILDLETDPAQLACLCESFMRSETASHLTAFKPRRYRVSHSSD